MAAQYDFEETDQKHQQADHTIIRRREVMGVYGQHDETDKLPGNVAHSVDAGVFDHLLRLAHSEYSTLVSSDSNTLTRADAWDARE